MNTSTANGAHYDAETIARSLGGKTRGTKGWWNAKCPCHDDRNPSLGLHDNDDGSISWKCHAGCDQRDIAKALKDRGLLPEKESPKRQKKKTQSRGCIVVTYDYVDENGKLLFQVVRYEPKGFSQRRPEGDGWVLSLDGVRRVLYRLPELLAADPAKPVFVTEGEKDTDRLRSLGLVATTNPQGADKWDKTDRGALAGRHVVILPDNDPAGRRHVQKVAADLAGKAASVRVLNLPGLGDKGDVSDWLDAGGTAEQLLELAAKTESRPWFNDLILDKDGRPVNCLANGAIILRKDPAFAGNLRFDELLQAAAARNMPWRSGNEWAEWEDIDDIKFAEWAQTRGVPLRPSTCADAVAAVAHDNRVHAVRDYLDGLKWDGKSRLNGWLFDYAGVTVREGQTEEGKKAAEAKRNYIREVGRRWMISAVARIYRPGCKVDCALILEGQQGAGKSSLLSKLTPQPDWFTDQIDDLGSKDSGQDLRGKWIIELAELSAMKRGDIERTKAFMSRSVDHYRPSYGRRSRDFPRQSVFAGTTNADAYLGDETGNRRFWPVKVETINLEGLSEVRDQLWAEAVAAFKAGEKWWLDAETEKAAGEEQAQRRISDPWERALFNWLDDQFEDFTISDALTQALDVPKEQQDQAKANRAARILKIAGWERVQRRVAGVRVWFYRRPSEEPPEPAEATESPVSPVSPVSEEPTGDGKALETLDVTSVTSVTSRSTCEYGGSAEVPKDNEPYPCENFAKQVVTGGDTGDPRVQRTEARVRKCRTCHVISPVNEAGVCVPCQMKAARRRTAEAAAPGDWYS